MPKIVIDEIASGYSLSKINDQFNKIESYINDKVLSRDSDGNANAMSEDLDMNSNQILNLPAPTAPTAPVRLGDIPDLVKQTQGANYVGETAPESAFKGMRWYDPSVPTTYVYDTTNGVGSWIEEPVQSLDGDLRTALSAGTADIAGVAAEDVVTHGAIRLQNPSAGNIAGQKHMVVRVLDTDSPTNVHQEPNGRVDQGTVTKYDFMLDPFDLDQANYRLGNIYTKTGEGSGFNGQNGVVVIGAKSEGDHFGVWPSINMGFSDDNSNGVPLKLVYFDTSDTTWRTPMKGAWRTGRNYTSGDFVLANFKLYQASTTGTSGLTKPNHTSGTASDGTIDWLFVRDYAAAAGSIKPTVLIGDRNDMPKFGWSGVRMQFAKDTMTWNGVKHIYANNSNANGVQLGMDTFTDDWKIVCSGGGYTRYSASNNFIQSVGLSYLLTEKTITTGTTIDVRATELVYLNYSGATSITTLTGRPNQKVFIHSANGNATLVHGAGIKLAGGVNKTLSSDDMLCFVFNSGGNIAKQVI